MANKRKMQFSNSRNQSGTRTFAINWFIILSVPPFTPGTRQHNSQSYPWEEAVHHWGQTLADYLENIAQNTVRNRKNYPKPDKLCGSANENLVFLASTAMENGGSSPREIISMMVYQHLSLRHRKYDQLEKNQTPKQHRGNELTGCCCFSKSRFLKRGFQLHMPEKINGDHPLPSTGDEQRNKKELHVLPVPKGVF